MAGEVMSDLEFLNDDLDSQLADPAPQMDQSFGLPAPEGIPAQVSPPIQAAPMPAQASPTVGDADPFGSLSGLVVDEEPKSEDRGSVLKFLRRD